MPKAGGTAERVLLYVSVTLIGLCIVFSLYLIATPSFDSAKTLAMGTILGALISLATAILGVSYASNMNRSNDSGTGGKGN